VVLAEGLEVDPEGRPARRPLEAPGEFAPAECGLAAVATPLYLPVVGLGTHTLVGHRARVEVDPGDPGGELPATARAVRHERHVGVVDRVLELREQLPGTLPTPEGLLDDPVERPGLVELGCRHHLDGDPDLRGALREQRGEVLAVGAVTVPERVRNVRVGDPEVPAECAGVDVAQFHERPVGVGELPGEFAQRVAVVGREELAHLVAALPEDCSDVVAPEDLVEVADVWDTRGGHRALEDDRLGRVAGLDLVGDLVRPEDAVLVGLAVGVGVLAAHGTASAYAQAPLKRFGPRSERWALAVVG
jgi:hypothetical protein